MNTYFVPVTESYGYNFDYIAYVYANSFEEAHQLTKELSDVKYYDRIVSDNINLYL